MDIDWHLRQRARREDWTAEGYGQHLERTSCTLLGKGWQLWSWKHIKRMCVCFSFSINDMEHFPIQIEFVLQSSLCSERNSLVGLLSKLCFVARSGRWTSTISRQQFVVSPDLGAVECGSSSRSWQKVWVCAQIFCDRLDSAGSGLSEVIYSLSIESWRQDDWPAFCCQNEIQAMQNEIHSHTEKISEQNQEISDVGFSLDILSQV